MSVGSVAHGIADRKTYLTYSCNGKKVVEENNPIIMAMQANYALDLLKDPTPDEKEALGSIKQFASSLSTHFGFYLAVT